MNKKMKKKLVCSLPFEGAIDLRKKTMFRALFPSANHTSTSVEDSLVTLQVQSLLSVIWKSREKGENEGHRRFFGFFFLCFARSNSSVPFLDPDLLLSASLSQPPSHSHLLALTKKTNPRSASASSPTSPLRSGASSGCRCCSGPGRPLAPRRPTLRCCRRPSPAPRQRSEKETAMKPRRRGRSLSR